jgi:photosystem II stability/assembly factor-like uncharacterized protein
VPTIEEIVASPADGAIVYARSRDAGGGDLFRSDDGGTSWQNVSPPFTATWDGTRRALGPVAVAPSDSSRAYRTVPLRVFRSVDGGETWAGADVPVVPVNISTTEPDRTLTGLAVAPWDPDLVIVTASRGAYRSPDGGATWNAIEPAVGAPLAFHPTAPGIVYATTYEGFAVGGMALSLDGGATWTHIPGRPGGIGTVRSIALDPADPMTVYLGIAGRFIGIRGDAGGIYRSRDGGQRWDEVSGDLPLTQTARADFHFIRSLVIDPKASSRLYVATPSGVYRTDNGGGQWTPLNLPPGVLAVGTGRIIED